MGLVSIAALIVLFLSLTGGRRHRGRDQLEAVNSARQIGFTLFDFESEYGAYPNADTVVAVQKATGTTLNLGTKTSNDFFRQLLAANFTQNEKMFYAKGSGIRKPDDVIAGTKALEKGECGFTYFLGASKLDNPSRPLAAAPMIPGTDRFDPEPFEGKAVFLKIDNSVISLPIDKHGHVIYAGRNLMDPHHPIWDGHAPSIAWPEL